MRRRISQREAHRLRKRVAELEGRISAMTKKWSSDFPGVCVGRMGNIPTESLVIVRTSQTLGYPVVCRPDGSTAFVLYAVKP